MIAIHMTLGKGKVTFDALKIKVNTVVYTFVFTLTFDASDVRCERNRY